MYLKSPFVPETNFKPKKKNSSHKYLCKFKVIEKRKKKNYFGLYLSHKKKRLIRYLGVCVCKEVEPCLLGVKVQSHCFENALFLSRLYLNMDNVWNMLKQRLVVTSK